MTTASTLIGRVKFVARWLAAGGAAAAAALPLSFSL